MITLRKYNGDFISWDSLTGLYDGINKIFYTSNVYKPGTAVLTYNGQSLYSDNDFIESGNKEITLVYLSPKDVKSLKLSYIRG